MFEDDESVVVKVVVVVELEDDDEPIVVVELVVEVEEEDEQPVPGHWHVCPETGLVELAIEISVGPPSFGMKPVWNDLSTNCSKTMLPSSGAFVIPAPTVPVMPKLPVIVAPEILPETGGVRTYQRRDGVGEGFNSSGQSFRSPEVTSRPCALPRSATYVVDATPLIFCSTSSAPLTK